MRGDKERPVLTDVINYCRLELGTEGRVPESEASGQTPSTGLRHSSFNHCRI